MTTLILQLVLAALLAAQSQAVPSQGAHGHKFLVETRTPLDSGISRFAAGEQVPGGNRALPAAQLVPPAQAIKGTANYADPSHGSAYLAMRLPRGTRVTITGPGGSWRATVNDYGPAKRTGDIADIALVHFARICGWSVAKAKRMGECTVTVEWGGDGPSPTLPPTDAAS